ncbi:uncharacterized protein LTHEOB_7702 [Lasiodiplodia theobromae]|uniref:uncharacterized protein n=1 Tax=Lasiodiplodia theobromae TaxID=45133 RepID=UPI0015C2F634|nr:uncharacterized protein LTHEOB_7702 [Lasiodiplodia theobromae]KAF4542510.1 hypothetical protein LTHEOB_7702 [Lasiodiplodia theobromae]
MPSARPQDAYSLLEQSFNDAPQLRAHKQFPRRQDDHQNVFPAAAPVRTSSYHDDETSTQFSSANSTPLASPLAPPPLVTGHDNGLPPTPPSASNDGARRDTSGTPQFADGVMDNLLSKQPSIRTPINQRSPPTPDPSPPRSTRSGQKTLPPPTIRYPSSRADSFTTARSHLESEDSESQASFHDALTPRQQGGEHARESRQRYDGLGLAFESEAGDVTPTERNPSGLPGYEDSPSLDGTWASNGRRDQIPDREWDTNFMRNVAVRRKRQEKPPRTPPEQTSPRDSGLDLSPISIMKRGQIPDDRAGDIKRHARNPTLDRFAQDIGWPSDAGESPKTDSKRFSTASSTSTVVEAVVVATPPERHRMLRHAGKNLALRQSSDTTFERSATRRAHRASLLSNDTPPHRLLHHKARIPERRNRDSIDSAFSYVSSEAPAPEPQQKHDSIPVLVVPTSLEDSPKAAETPRRLQVQFHSLTDTQQSPSRVSEVPNGDSVHVESPRRVHRKSSFGSSSIVSKASSKVPEDWPLPREGIRNFTAPAVMTSKGTTITLSRAPSSPQREASFRRKVDITPPPVPPKEPLSLSTPPLSPTDRISSPPATSEVQRLLQQRRPVDSMITRRSSDRTSSRTEEVPRGSSLDRSMSGDRTHLSPESPMMIYSGRTSLDRARHHNTTTPFSQMSDTSGLEISEATAISIYPHNNHSLLVVQQVAQTDSNSNSNSSTTYHTTTSRRRSVSSPPLSRELSPPLDRELTPPTLTFNPATPPQQLIDDSEVAANGSVDSPLKNPRKPPEPPAFKIIPPTPASELERDPMGESAIASSSSRPKRRQTLAKRARRYSDTILNPILGRTTSAAKRSPKGQANAAATPKQPKDANLHPFWRPRGFWDDFDSESEDEWDEEFGDDHDRLPRGGDTSDVGEEDEERERQKRKIGALGRRLTNGFKGSGGFLIGNSLGMERHGSNARRHYVNVSGLTSKTSGFMSKPLALGKRFGGSSGRVEKQVANQISSQVSSYSLRRVAANNASLRHAAVSPAGSGASQVSRFSTSTAGGDSDEDRGWGRGSSRGRSTSSQRPTRKREFSVPGTRWNVEYVGISGVRERLAEKRREKKRNELRRMIGPKFYIKSTSIV